MPFCPNLSNPEVKKQFDGLINKFDEDIAYYLWDKYQGNIPTTFVIDQTDRVNSYFQKRFGDNSVFIKNALESLDSGLRFGYVQEGAAHLSQFAPLDAKYHEAFHIFFRTTLNDVQREQLYKDAVERYGEPTAEDIARARKDLKEKISDADARLLALEEKMAEEFRFYSMSESAPKGMGQRIAKFFKDLLAYVRALVGKPLTTRQAYRLIESNKIPAKFVRGATQFKGSTTANMIKRFATDIQMHEELTRVGAAMIVDSYDALMKRVDPSDRKGLRKAMSRKTRNLLGDPKVKGRSEVRDYFLRLSMSDANGNMLSYQEFAKVRRLHDAANEDESKLQELIDYKLEQDIYDSPPIFDQNGNLISKLFEDEYEDNPDKIGLEDYFKAVYDNWYDFEDENGRKITGFRSDTAVLLQEFGLRLTEREVEFKDEEGQERIYSISRLEEDPGKTLTQKQRILLSRIPVDSDAATRTGIRTYIPAMEVYRTVLNIVTDSSNFTEMLTKLQKKGESIPSMLSVYNFINSLEADQQASLFYAFNTASQEFLRVEVETTKSGKDKVVSSKIYSPNDGSVLRSYELTWKENSTLPRKIFRKLPGGGFRVNPARQAKIEKLAEEVGISVEEGILLSPNLNTKQQAALGRLFWEMGIEIGVTEQESIDRVQAVFKTKGKDKFRLKTFINNTRFIEIVSALVNNNELGTNFFDDEGTTIKEIIKKFVAPFTTAKSNTFVDSLRRSIYPINKKSRLNDEEIRIANGELREFITNTLQHNMYGASDLLYRLLQNDGYTKNFKFKTLEAFGEQEEDEMTNNVVETMNFETLLAARMNAFYNTGRKEAFVAMDTPGDRKRPVLIPIPKLERREQSRAFGMSTFEPALRDGLVLDLIRMQEAREQISAAVEGEGLGILVEGYHYNMVEDEDTGELVPDFSAGSWNKFNVLPKVVEVDSDGIIMNQEEEDLIEGIHYYYTKDKVAEIETDEELTAAFEGLVGEVDAAIEENFVRLARRIGGKVTKKGKVSFPLKSAGYKFLAENVDNKALGRPTEFVRNYALYDYMGRLLSRSMFRAGVNVTKDGKDYVKRAQLITTPGGKPILKGDIPSNPEYGLSPRFNASTIRDVLVSLDPETLDAYKSNIAKILGSEAAAERIVAGYLGMESTDAQAFISPKHFYEIMQGKGEVDASFEEVYRAYVAAEIGEGIWDPSVPISAMKPSYDGPVKRNEAGSDLIVNYSDKTSYIVLTDELVEGIPVLQDLLNRMEARGEFYEGMEPIEVVHAISAQKLAVVPAYEVKTGAEATPGQFAGLNVAEMDSQFLRFPEEVPIKGSKDELGLGHQAKVNMLTNIFAELDYTYNAGLDFAETVKGNQLQDIFHSAVSEKINRALAGVHKELGYDKVLEAKDEAQRQKAIEEFLPKVKAKLESLAREKGFNEGVLEALESLPFGYPTLQSKFDQLIFSIYKNDVYKQRVKGQQMVQFADLGGRFSDLGTIEADASLQENLKFLEVKDNRLAHAQVDVGAGYLVRAGIDPKVIDEARKTGDMSKINEGLKRIMGYRIPQQGKSSLLIMEVRNLLPRSHDGVIRVPPGITAMMGSDFDIDKMFILFPEIENGEKVQVPYGELKDNLEGMSELSNAQLNNVFFDTFEAVASNLNHMHEVVTPLDGPDLKVARDNAPAMFQSKELDIFSTVDAIQSTVDNMLSHRLRGIWADAVLGRNVLFGSQVEEELLEGELMTFIEDDAFTVTTSTLQQNALFEDATGAKRPTDYFMSLHLGSAVDSVKDPLQRAINDSELTAKISTYLYSRGLTPRQVSTYLNHPVVRAVTEKAKKNGQSISKSLLSGTEYKILKFAKPLGDVVLDFEEMRRQTTAYLVEDKTPTKKEYARMLQILQLINREANDLYNLYSAITPFTIDKSGTTAQNLAQFDKIDYYLTKAAGGSVYGGKALLLEILEGDAYRSSRAYWEAIQKALELASDAGFLANQPGYQMFRKAVMNMGKGSPFGEGVQKALLMGVNHHLVTKPGSPLYEQGFLDKTLVQDLLLEGEEEGSILSQLDNIKSILDGKGVFNALIDSLEPAQYEFNNTKKKKDRKRMVYVEYNNRQSRDVGQQNAIIAGWEELYFNLSGIFNEEEAAYANKFARDLLTTAIVTTGFGPGPRSMMNVLPPSILEDIGVTEHYNQEIEQLRMGRTELGVEFQDDFLVHYGAYSYSGETILSEYRKGYLGLVNIPMRIANEETVRWDKDAKGIPPKYMYVRGIGIVKATPKFIGDSTVGDVLFEVVQRRSVKGRFYEHNLRTETGEPMDGSLVFETRGLKKLKSEDNNAPEKDDVDAEQIKAENEEAAEAAVSEEPTAADFSGNLSEMEKGKSALSDLTSGAKTDLSQEETTKINPLTGLTEGNPTIRQLEEKIFSLQKKIAFNMFFGRNQLEQKQKVEAQIKDLQEQLGELTDDSLALPTKKKSLLNLTVAETPIGAEAKIARLTSSFAAAGVELPVVLTSLPAGTKGMVENGVITLDPAQMSEDTVYHEAGHILIDMLPEEDVRQFAAQVEKTRPDLAAMIRREYENEKLDEFGMLKEILVTAVGLEGARIERKNPSKLRILINRIMRAIGKLFGITPDAAAVLAEKMFAGDIRAMVLTGKRNPRVQKSKQLDERLDDIFEEGYQSLEKQIRMIKRKPSTLQTKAEVLKVKQLQNTLKEISENKNSIKGFLTFASYVHDQVALARAVFNDLQKAKDKPVSKEDALGMLQRIGQVKHTIDTFFSPTDRSRSLVDKLQRAVQDVIGQDLEDGNADYLFSEQILHDLNKSIAELQDLEEEYIETIAPLVADAYAAYIDPNINAKIDEVIAATRANMDTSGMSRDPDYQALKKRKKQIEETAEFDGLDPKQEWKRAVIELKIEKLQAKKLNRDNIIKELTDAHTDKSAFALWLDPMVYSSEANLQMFALALNEGNFGANRKSLAVINEAAEYYREFKDYMGDDTNKAKFFGDLIEVVEVKSRGVKGESLRQLALVQPTNTAGFYLEMQTFLQNLAKDTERPDYDPESEKSKKEYQKWILSKKGRNYFRRKAAWFAENTVEVDNAAAKLLALTNERKELIAQRKVAEDFEKPGEAAILQEYINDLNIRIRSSYDRSTQTYMGELAKPNEEKWQSEKYKKIQRTPELKKMYNFLLETYKEKQQIYGQNNPQHMNPWDNFSYILPSVRQSNVEAIGRLGLKGVIVEAKDAFVRTETDQEMYGAAVDFEGKSERYLPRYYTNPVDEKEVTRDILSSILMFSHRSHQYAEKAKLVGLVNAMADLHKQRRVIQKDDQGATLLDREAVRFKNLFEKYSVDTTATTPGDASNTVNHLMQFIDSAFYGIHKKKIEDKILGMDPTKFVGTINSMAALGSLSFNFLQIGNQFVLDNLMVREEAIAGEFFDNKDLRWAKGMFIKEGAGVGDIGKFAATSKLGKAMLHYDALVEATDSLGRDASNNKFLKAIQTGNLLALQGAVEYETAAVRMLASMKALEGKLVDKNGKVIQTEEGKDANLWDLMVETKNGVELDPRVDMEKSGFNESVFMAKLRGLYKRTNQVKGNFDASTLSRTPFGAFLMLFKNYFIPGWRKRWGHGDIYHRDLELGTVTRGMYISLGSFLRLGHENGYKFSKVWDNTASVDKMNIKRAVTEMGALGTVMLIFSALTSILDDDDEDSYAAAYIAYQARRLQTELLGYINPGEALRMFVAPMAAANRLQKYWDLVTHLALAELPYNVRQAVGAPVSEKLEKEVIYQRDSYWGEEGDRKLWGKVGKVMPIIYGFSTADTKTVEDKIRFFE